jgi:predicted cation transporter
MNMQGKKMNQTIGAILSIAGLIGVIFFGYQYMADTESFQLLGADIAVSTGDYIPILISAVVLIVGLVLYRSK